MFWYKGWCSSLLLPCPGIYCFWARASYGTAAHYGAVLGDLEILIPEALADALGFQKNGRCWRCGWKRSPRAGSPRRGDVHFRHGGHAEAVVTRGDICRKELHAHGLCYVLPWAFSNSSTLTVWYFWIYTPAWVWWVLSAPLIATSFLLINRTPLITCHCSIAYELPFWHNSMKTD